jgi:opacity protein-like surface antigen
MQKILLAALLAVVPSIAHAQFAYVEGAVGVGLHPDIETNTYTFITPQGEIFSGNAESSINASWAFGAEVGYQTGPWRLGASWDFIDAETDTARLEGTLDGVPFSFEANDQDLQDFGLDANHDTNIFAANAYYVFNAYNVSLIGAGVQPYVGIGLGAATFHDANTQFAFTATLGASVPLGPQTYIGARYRLFAISGPTLDNGIKIDGFTAHAFSVVLGYRFGA